MNVITKTLFLRECATTSQETILNRFFRQSANRPDI